MENPAIPETHAETPAAPLADPAPQPATPAQPESAASAQARSEAQNPPVSGAPETYQPFAVPDGLAVDSEQMADFTALARELNLSQEAAQKLVDMQARHEVATRDGWYAASQSDPEFGGQHLKTNLETAMRAVDAFGTPELKRLLVDTGLGDHPEVIRMFFRAGKSLAPDRIVGGQSAGTGNARGLAERLYHTT